MINTNEFKNYLIAKGYSEFTKSGRKSTVYDYAFGVQHVCRTEQLNIKDLSDKIEALILDYSICPKSDLIAIVHLPAKITPWLQFGYNPNLTTDT